MTEYHELFLCELKENRRALLEVAQQSQLERKRPENINFPLERCSISGHWEMAWPRAGMTSLLPTCSTLSLSGVNVTGCSQGTVLLWTD